MSTTISIISIVFVLFAAFAISYSASKHFYTSVFDIINILQNGGETAISSDSEFKFIKNNILKIRSHSYNIETELARKISELKKAQILALQEQINPHFIFNSLNLISMTDMAEHHKPTQISRIVTLLSDILSGILHGNNYTISFKAELDYLQKYIELQNIRNGNRINYITNIAPGVCELSCVKFMLQPIVENSIKYGIIHSGMNNGTVSLAAEIKNSDFEITISDNGIGMRPEVLSSLNDKLSRSDFLASSDHIGILNVHQRIRLIYGEKYGLSVSSDKNGTKVKYTLPVIPISKTIK